MREHIGKHILRALRGTPDADLKAEIGDKPCGWCGREECKTQLHPAAGKKKSVTITSNCAYHYERINYSITMNEERAMGIDEQKTKMWRLEHEIPDSDGFLMENERDGRKR
ncbi:hypothetical protein H0H81_008917, partial [Sphagnurus paluster]